MGNIPVGFIVALVIILVLVAAIFGRMFYIDWSARKQAQTVIDLAAKKKAAEDAVPKLFVNRRYGVLTAYFEEDLKGVSGGMLMPRPGMMVFTNDENCPRTGTVAMLDKLVSDLGRNKVWVSEYAFYTIGCGLVPAKQDYNDYGKYVLGLADAMVRFRAYKAAA
jgi:hypothetical protein